MKSTIKILFITHYSSLYGANRSLLNLLEGFQGLNVQPMVVVPVEGEICHFLEENNIPYVIQPFTWWCSIGPKSREIKKFSFKRWFTEWKNSITDKRNTSLNLQSLENKIAEFKPNWVYSNSSVFNFGLLFAQKHGIPHIWHLREVHEHFGFTWSYSLKKVKNDFQKSEIVIAISSYVKNNFEKKKLVENAIVVYDGVLSVRGLENLDKEKEGRELNTSSLIFGIVGIIHPNKGQEDAIRAFSIVSSSYPSSKLIVVGLGPQDYLKQLAYELGVLETIEFWGHLTNPFDAFLSMDVLLMCSKMEGLGRVTIEAMASGIPIIGYGEGGTLELIKNNITGLFYQKGPNDLAEKMLYMIDNETERLRMGRKGREMFKSNFTSEICAKKIYNYIKEME